MNAELEQDSGCRFIRYINLSKIHWPVDNHAILRLLWLHLWVSEPISPHGLVVDVAVEDVAVEDVAVLVLLLVALLLVVEVRVTEDSVEVDEDVEVAVKPR